jgi:hypothetical protein
MMMPPDIGMGAGGWSLRREALTTLRRRLDPTRNTRPAYLAYLTAGGIWHDTLWFS